jgi:carboxypeptidase C (cathepsin A)
MRFFDMRSHPLILFCFILFTFITEVAAENQSPEVDQKAGCNEKNVKDEIALSPDQESKTKHLLKFGEKELSYVATAGVLPIQIGGKSPECRIFYISYGCSLRDSALRPLTFVFNGGPGASAAYLHLAALGPVGVHLGEDGNLPGPPVKLIHNINTWLRFTDLVFVDPVGTGYSRCVLPGCDTKEDKEPDARLWGVQEDLKSLAEFIRLFLTRNNRWLSPKFLIGESYGGFRVAALSDILQSNYGVGLNGIVLISPALEFGLLRGHKYSLLPWVITIPSFAATAGHHRKVSKEPSKERNPRDGLAAVEQFSIKELLPALAGHETESIYSQISSYIGIPVDFVSLHHARIPALIFAKELLRDENRLISLYDGSHTSIDPEPADPFSQIEDPALVRLNILLTSALNSYVRDQLKFNTDIPYLVLNSEVSKNWNWKSTLDWGQGYAGVAENLKKSMSMFEEMKVLIAHGVFDLVTPYFGSVIVIRQMSLDSRIASNIILKVYDGGHMFYTHSKGKVNFFRDVDIFFKESSGQ